MIDSRILIGLIAILITISSIVIVGINEVDRQAEFEAAFHGRSVEAGAAIFEQYCKECHGINGQGVPGLGPTLNSKQFFEQRLKELGYQGTLKAYIELTVAGGRPVKSDQSWPRNMPTWSVEYGGPLRHDQIVTVVDYILNWEKGALDQTAGPAQVSGDTPEARGLSLFQSAGCIGCHQIAGQGGTVGPELTNVFAKGEDYVRESILMPNAVVADGYQPNVMPAIFADTLTAENIDDIVAYLASVNSQ
jgi:mono/diheme cytochrome c family protein